MLLRADQEMHFYALRPQREGDASVRHKSIWLRWLDALLSYANTKSVNVSEIKGPSPFGFLRLRKERNILL